MKNIQYPTFNGKILSGSKEVIISKYINAGEVLVASLFPVTQPSTPVKFKIIDTGGNAIIDPSNSKDWERRTGASYLDSQKPTRFPGGQEVRVVAYSDTNQTADFEFELMLVLQTSN